MLTPKYRGAVKERAGEGGSRASHPRACVAQSCVSYLLERETSATPFPAQQLLIVRREWETEPARYAKGKQEDHHFTEISSKHIV